MAKNFNELRRAMTPERRKRNAKEAARMLQNDAALLSPGKVPALKARRR